MTKQVEPIQERPDGRTEGTQPPDERVPALQRQISELSELVQNRPGEEDTTADEHLQEIRAELRSLATAAKDTDATLRGVIERLGAAAPVDAGFVQEMEARLAERVELQRSALGADLEGQLAVLHAMLEEQARRAEQLASAQHDLRQHIQGLDWPVGDPSSPRLHALEERLAELQRHMDTEVVRAQAEPARVEEANERLRTMEGQLERGLARLAERPEVDQRLAAIDIRLQQLEDRLNAQDAFAGPDAVAVEEARSGLSAVETRLNGLQDRFDALAVRAEANTATIDERLEAETARRSVDAGKLDEVHTGLGQIAERIEALETRALAEVRRIEDELRQRVDALAQERRPMAQRLDAFDERIGSLQEAVEAASARAGADATRGEEVRAVVARLEADLSERATATADRGRRLEGMDERLRDLEGSIAGLRAESAELHSQLIERLDRHAERAARPSGTDARLTELEDRLDESVGRLTSSLESLHADFSGEVGQWRLDAQSASTAMEHAMQLRLEQVEGAQSQAASQLSELASTASALTALEQNVNRRLERLEDVGSHALQQQSELADTRSALTTLERAVDRRLNELQDAESRWAKQLAELAQTRPAGSGLEEALDGRLKQLEEAEAQRARQLSELADLQAALDIGLGELRSEIEQVRETAKRAAHFDSRLEAAAAVPDFAPVEQERGWRGSKKTADALATLSGLVQNLLHDHRQLRAQVGTLENESETAVRASARASAQAMGVHPLRQELKAMRAELAEQAEAMAALADSLESLTWEVTSQTVPSLAAPPKKTTAAKKPTAAKKAAAAKTPAKKAPTVTKATKAAKAAKATKAAKKGLGGR